MSPKEKTKETPKPGATAPEGKAPAPAAGGGPKPSMSSGGSGRGGAGAKVGCQADTCKSPDTRASFCEEHFRQYKFGLITKNGKQVSDYERKLEHYQNWLKSQVELKRA